ncbi:MAG: TRAP transporter large permease subunit, partial [Woeseiaceae bacterium]|nr:TRAP transporter large permease subunit [Woeseiaceae bacterium]
MGGEVIGLLAVALLCALILLKVPIGVSLALAGLVSTGLLIGFDAAFAVVGIEVLAELMSQDLALVALFLLMGNLAGAAGLSSDLYALAEAWLGHRRGGLAMATMGACAGFGAICGSSIATTATMTRLALPEMRKRGYTGGLA